MISTLEPLRIILSICWVCVGMSSPAYSRSTLYPRPSRPDLTALPSAIQHDEVSVGIATPIRPPAAGAAPVVAGAADLVVVPAPEPPQAASDSAITPAAAT